MIVWWLLVVGPLVGTYAYLAWEYVHAVWLDARFDRHADEAMAQSRPTYSQSLRTMPLTKAVFEVQFEEIAEAESALRGEGR